MRKTIAVLFLSVCALRADTIGEGWQIQIDTNPPYILNDQTYDHNPTEVTDTLLAQNEFIATTYGNMATFNGGSTPAVLPFHVIHTNAIVAPPPPSETPSDTPEPATWGMLATGFAALFFIRRKVTA